MVLPHRVQVRAAGGASVGRAGGSGSKAKVKQQQGAHACSEPATDLPHGVAALRVRVQPPPHVGVGGCEGLQQLRVSSSGSSSARVCACVWMRAVQWSLGGESTSSGADRMAGHSGGRAPAMHAAGGMGAQRQGAKAPDNHLHPPALPACTSPHTCISSSEYAPAWLKAGCTSSCVAAMFRSPTHTTWGTGARGPRPRECAQLRPCECPVGRGGRAHSTSPYTAHRVPAARCASQLPPHLAPRRPQRIHLCEQRPQEPACTHGGRHCYTPAQRLDGEPQEPWSKKASCERRRAHPVAGRARAAAHHTGSPTCT